MYERVTSVQIQTMISTYIRMLDQAALLKRLEHCEEGEHDKYEAILQRKNKGGAQ